MSYGFCDRLVLSEYMNVEKSTYSCYEKNSNHNRRDCYVTKYDYNDDEGKNFVMKVRDIAILFSEEGIGPPVFEIKNKMSSIEIHSKRLEVLYPSEMNECFENMEIETIIREIRNIIRKMHNLGYAHGDLHMSNIGYDIERNKFYLLDYDTVFNIENDKDEEWLKDWMENFPWDESYESFVQYDYTNWISDWISE